MRTLFATLAFALALVGSADAAAVAPTKASQLLTIYTTGGCSIGGAPGGNSAAFTQMVRPDGTIGAFTIPPKQVFVITEATVTTAAEPAGDAMLTLLVIGTPTAGAPVGARFETVASNGTVTSTFLIPNGVTLKSTSTACAQMFNQTHVGSVFPSAVAHGFFAPDK